MPVSIISDEEEVLQKVEEIKTGKTTPVETQNLDNEDFEEFDDPSTPFEQDEATQKDSEFTEVDEEEGEWGKPTEEEPEEEQKVEPEPAEEQKLSEDLETVRKLIDTGEESLGKVKGQEIDFAQLTPPERLALQQKGFRFYQAMEEVSQQEDNLKKWEAKLTQDAQYLNKLIQSGQFPGKPSPEGGATTPAELQDDEMDTDQVKALKAFSRNLASEVGSLKVDTQQRQLVQGERELMADIEKLQETYPCASTEEIIAVKAMYNDIPNERIAMKSHQKYSSIPHVENIYAHCPEVKRHFSDMAVKDYLASLKRTKTVAQKASSGGGGRIVAESKPKPKGLDYDWDDAEADINKRIREIQRIEAEEA